MNRSAVLVSLILAVTIVIAGCAARRTPYDDLYAQLTEDWRTTDWSVLENRTIVIDPGHGGTFNGAMGPDSLREADANLGVALYLWGLLEEAGADVHLTRTTDRDFLPEGSEELAHDLENRVNESNRLDPEVFISIHHNSNLALDREVNSVEIYYRGDDPEASLELARDIHIHLARNLGIEETVIIPGNYYVLRNSTAGAAVLGEASYISHPVVEDRLKLSNKQKLEAEAYFLGLISYFSRGVPSIERHKPESDTLLSPGEIAFTVRRGGGVPIDPATARIVIGDTESVAAFDPLTGMLRYALEKDMPNGQLTVRAKIRSTGGATAASNPLHLVVSRPPAYILALPATKKADGAISLQLKVLDELGLPVADGTRVKATPLQTETSYEGMCAKGIFTFDTDEAHVAGAFAVEVAGKRDTMYFKTDERFDSIPLRVVDHSSGEGIPFPLAIAAGDTALRGDAHGWLHFEPPYLDRPIVAAAAGYGPAVFEYKPEQTPQDEIALTPLFGKVLHGIRIVLDPAGGGVDDGGHGTHELRGASVNLAVARRIHDLCTRAGASVTLARSGEETLSIAERIHRINRYRPEVAISIHHGNYDESSNDRCTALHYPGSKQGILLAHSLADELAGLPPCEEYSVRESARTFLLQTSCPACEIHCGSIEDESSETVFSNPSYITLAAERIFTALVKYLGNERWDCNGLVVTVHSSGQPLDNATVSIDQTFTLLTDEDGTVRFGCVDAGTHLITVTTDERNSYVFVREIEDPFPSVLILEITSRSFNTIR